MQELERKLVDNKVVVTYKEELPRYSIKKTQASYWWENGGFNYVLLDRGIVIYSIQYPDFNNTDYDNDSRIASEVLEDFTKWAKEKYKDYDVYVLQEYRHSGSTFHLTPTTEKIDKWDSGVVGFVALPKTVDVGHLANEITDVFNGSIYVVGVVDNLTDDVEEQYEFWENAGNYDEERKIREHIKKEFNCEVK